MARRGSSLQRALRHAQRDAHLTSRTLGDVSAALRGPDALAKRLVRRSVTRTVLRLLRP